MSPPGAVASLVEVGGGNVEEKGKGSAERDHKELSQKVLGEGLDKLSGM